MTSSKGLTEAQKRHIKADLMKDAEDLVDDLIIDLDIHLESGKSGYIETSKYGLNSIKQSFRFHLHKIKEKRKLSLKRKKKEK